MHVLFAVPNICAQQDTETLSNNPQIVPDECLSVNGTALPPIIREQMARALFATLFTGMILQVYDIFADFGELYYSYRDGPWGVTVRPWSPEKIKYGSKWVQY